MSSSAPSNSNVNYRSPWERFKKQPLGIAAALYCVLVGFLAITAYIWAPDNSQYANQMHLEIHSKPPGFTSEILVIENPNSKNQSKLSKWFLGDKFPNQEIPISTFKTEKNRIYYLPYGISDKSFEKSIAKQGAYVETKNFILGTDKYGRDLLSRTLIGARISFFIGFIAVFISLVVGLSIGSIAGYFGGRIDAILMWLINVTWSIPTLLLVIAITLALGKGFWQVFIAVGLTMWVEVARVVRGQVLSAKKLQYVEAAQTLGYSNTRIIFRHILPNIFGPLIVISAANFAASILIESGLSFLGIGAQPPIPSWGSMIKDHYNYLLMGKAYLALVPGLAIMSLVMAFMLIGNALRDVLDIKS
jgi:peptide/nickel transport system permease protein